MKKFCLLFYIFLSLLFPKISAFSEMLLSGGINMIDHLPQEFFGTWQVVGVQTFANSPDLIAPYSVDIWNISRYNDVITLTNPISGATASIKIDEVKNNTVKFSRNKVNSEEKVLETPILNINGENFTGTDKIVVEKYKQNKLVKIEITEYKVVGKKISGEETAKILNNIRKYK